MSNNPENDEELLDADEAPCDSCEETAPEEPAAEPEAVATEAEEPPEAEVEAEEPVEAEFKAEEAVETEAEDAPEAAADEAEAEEAATDEFVESAADITAVLPNVDYPNDGEANEAEPEDAEYVEEAEEEDEQEAEEHAGPAAPQEIPAEGAGSAYSDEDLVSRDEEGPYSQARHDFKKSPKHTKTAVKLAFANLLPGIGALMTTSYAVDWGKDSALGRRDKMPTKLVRQGMLEPGLFALGTMLVCEGIIFLIYAVIDLILSLMGLGSTIAIIVSTVLFLLTAPFVEVMAMRGAAYESLREGLRFSEAWKTVTKSGKGGSFFVVALVPSLITLLVTVVLGLPAYLLVSIMSIMAYYVVTTTFEYMLIYVLEYVIMGVVLFLIFWTASTQTIISFRACGYVMAGIGANVMAERQAAEEAAAEAEATGEIEAAEGVHPTRPVKVDEDGNEIVDEEAEDESAEYVSEFEREVDETVAEEAEAAAQEAIEAEDEDEDDSDEDDSDEDDESTDDDVDDDEDEPDEDEDESDEDDDENESEDDDSDGEEEDGDED